MLLPRVMAACCLLTASTATVAQVGSDPHVGPASFQQAAPRTVRFARQEPQVGDQVEQSVSLELRIRTTVHKDQQIVEQGATSQHREQRRQVTTTAVEGDRTTAVRVRYLAAKTETARGDQAEEHSSQPAAERQPVEGKVYDCRRDGEQLIITDENGNIPPIEEYQIVAENMEVLGRVNPLAEFLVGRSVTVGQQIALPREVAERLLGMGDRWGDVHRFELTLIEVRTVDGAPCAVFQAVVEAASNDSSQMRLEVGGPLIIQVPTCRAVLADFVGPIGMVETRGSLNHTYQTAGTGRMAVRIASTYRDVAR
jgi:hypothetical protein